MMKPLANAAKAMCMIVILVGLCRAGNASPAPDSGASASPSRPRIIQSDANSQPLQIAVYNAVGNTQISPANLRPASAEEMGGMEQTLQKYQDGFENLSMTQVLQVWPTLDKRRKAKLGEVFQAFRTNSWTRKLDLQCAAPTVVDQSASLDCRETLAYGPAKAAPRHAGPVRVAILLKQQADGWVLENMKRLN